MTKRLTIIIILLTAWTMPAAAWSLWYRQAPSTRKVINPWMEYGLPIGNGQLGGMVMGGISAAELQLNEKTFWTGDTEKRGAYQNLGYLRLRNLCESEADSCVEDYRIELSLDEAVVREEWTDNEGSHFTREYLASRPDECIALHLESKQGNPQNQLIYLEGTHQETPHYSGATGYITTPLDLLHGALAFRITTPDGTLLATDEGIELRDATEALIIVSARTNYDPLAVAFTRDSSTLLSDLQEHISNVPEDWEHLKERHLSDYQSLFQKMELTLEQEEPIIPTDELITRYNTKASAAERRFLEQLYFAYGRYLLIASSRGIALPANLQGIWNDSNDPPWASDIHANINVQMNYWPAEVVNLGETAVPLFDWIYNNAIVQPYWRQYALDYTGVEAGWLCFWENNNTGFSWVAYPEHSYCAVPAWLCWHLWQHYLYTLDKNFLRERALPVMLSCIDFWMNRLVRDKNDGTWVCPQEWSPEQGPLDDGTAHTQQCVWMLFSTTLQAIEALGNDEAGITEATLSDIRDYFNELDDGLHTEVYDGSYGTTSNGVEEGDLLLREWKNFACTEAAKEQQHRHVSHLMCLYPFNSITPSHPLMPAVINSMKLRGERNTGWAMAWKINLWARARQADMAYSLLRTALNHAKTYKASILPSNAGVYYNLLDAHPPFQIDGNSGACAGIAEMLLQSYADTLRLLPTLPVEWEQSGHVRGIRGEGAFELDYEWEDASITQLTIHSLAGHECHLQLPLGWAARMIAEDSGDTVASCTAEEGRLNFATDAGSNYLLAYNPDPETGISPTPYPPTSHHPTIFDLTGRRLTSPPAHGIYIRNGKKVVVK